jgi:hypothetical protein
MGEAMTDETTFTRATPEDCEDLFQALVSAMHVRGLRVNVCLSIFDGENVRTVTNMPPDNLVSILEHCIESVALGHTEFHKRMTQ